MRVIEQLVHHFWARGALTRAEALYLVKHGFARESDLPGLTEPGQTIDPATYDPPATYNRILVQTRGTGDSDPVDPPSYLYDDYAADIDKVVKALDLRDFVLIGHSMGGTVSLLYAATYPERVRSLRAAALEPGPRSGRYDSIPPPKEGESGAGSGGRRGPRKCTIRHDRPIPREPP